MVEGVDAAVQGAEKARVHARLADVQGPDLADLIEVREPEDRVRLILALGSEFDFEVLTEVDEKVRDQISRALATEVRGRARGSGLGSERPRGRRQGGTVG